MLNDADVGFIDDAIGVLANDLAGEDHSQNSFLQTKDEDFLKVAKILRESRSKLLYKLTKENNGESYCLGKHLLRASIGYKELSNRMMEAGDISYAKELLEQAELREKIFKLINLEEKSKIKKEVKQ